MNPNLEKIYSDSLEGEIFNVPVLAVMAESAAYMLSEHGRGCFIRVFAYDPLRMSIQAELFQDDSDLAYLNSANFKEFFTLQCFADSLWETVSPLVSAYDSATQFVYLVSIYTPNSDKIALQGNVYPRSAHRIVTQYADLYYEQSILPARGK